MLEKKILRTAIFLDFGLKNKQTLDNGMTGDFSGRLGLEEEESAPHNVSKGLVSQLK